jgi:hypothetical protein
MRESRATPIHAGAADAPAVQALRDVGASLAGDA